MNRRSQFAAWFVATLLLTSAVVIAASTVRMVVDCWVPVPILDQWAQLVGSRSVTLSWLLSQHNEHRLFFPRLVFVLDREFAAETGALALAVSVVTQGALMTLLMRLGRAAGIRSLDLATGSAIIVALLSWSVQYENYTWAFQVQFFGVLFAAAACFAAVAAGRSTSGGAALVVALGLLATLTLSSGIAVPFLAAAMAIWLRRPAGYVAVLGAAALAILGGYLASYQTPPEHTDPMQAVMQPLALLRYAAAVIGGPFANAIGLLSGQVDPWVAEITGGVGLALVLAIGIAMIRRRAPVVPASVALLALCGFVLAMALLTALGRLRFGVTSALVSRYATPALVFWACLFLLAMARRHLSSTGAGGIAAAFLLLVGWTQPRFIHVARQLSADRAIAMPALVAGVADGTLIAPIYANARVPLQERLTEFATRTGPFSQVWAPWIGTSLHDHAVPADAARCAGRFDTATPISDPAYPGWRVQGDLLRPPMKRTRQVVVLTDPADRIVGYGISDADATTLTVGGPAGEPPRTGWVGAIRGAEPAGVKAFVLLDRFTSACPLQNEPRLETALQVALSGPAPESALPAGAVDAAYLGQDVTVDGWALVQTDTGAPRIALDTNLPVQSVTIVTVARPDAAAVYHDPRLARSGFRIVLLLKPGEPAPAAARLCVWSEDAVYGTHRLVMNAATEVQRKLCPADRS